MLPICILLCWQHKKRFKMHYWQVSYKEFSDYIQLYLFFFLLFPQRGQLYPYSLPFKITVRNSEWEVILIQSKLASVPCIKAGVLLSHQYKYLGSVYIRGLPRGGRGRRGARGGGMLLLCWSSINQSINQSIIYFNTLCQRAKKLVQNTNV